MSKTKYSISTNDDDQYLFYLPITIWLHYELHGFETIYFVLGDKKKFDFVDKWIDKRHTRVNLKALNGYRDATIVQLSRLFGYLYTGKDDNIMIGDVDMLQFAQIPDCNIYGSDLVGFNQYPMQYTKFLDRDWETEQL